MQKSTTVLSVPLRDLDAELQRVESWRLFLPELEGVEQTAGGRYTFTVRQDGRSHEVRVVVRRSPRGNGLLWTALDGPAWNGHLYLQAIDERRTRVHLEMHVDPRSFLGHLVELLRSGDARAQIGLFRLQEVVHGRTLRSVA